MATEDTSLTAIDENAVIASLLQELGRARHKFPTQSRETTLLALVEEVGELAQAHLQRQDEARFRREAVQVATMALRCILDTGPL